MAENKKSIIIYADWIENFENLSDEEAGRLIKHFFRYINDLNPNAPDRLTELLFIPLKSSLKRDLQKWESTIEERAKNGRIGNIKRWNTDLYDKLISEEITLEEAEKIAKHRKTSLGDKNNTGAIKNVANIAVNDSVTVTVNDILLKKETKENFSFKNAMIEFGFEKKLVDEWLKVRKTKRATNTETAFKKFIEQVKKTNAHCDEILELCVFRSWSGYNSEWFEKEKISAKKENNEQTIGRTPVSAIKNTINAFRD